MNHEIHILQLGDVELEASFLVPFKDPGKLAVVPTQGFLILGNPVGPILVDTGYRSPKVMEGFGMKGILREGYGLEKQLGKHGLDLRDIKMILHTHLHIDHAGKDDLFPMSTPVVINRREFEIAATGGPVYPLADIKHLLERFHTPGAVRVLDLAESGPVHIAPGIRCELTGGHTEGSMNVLIETNDGIACICGDLVYDVQNQLVNPWRESLYMEPQTTQNYTTQRIREKGAIKKALESGVWLLPNHDKPAKLEWGTVVGRVEGPLVPGPVSAIKR